MNSNLEDRGDFSVKLVDSASTIGSVLLSPSKLAVEVVVSKVIQSKKPWTYD